jgi:hypothetical protein
MPPAGDIRSETSLTDSCFIAQFRRREQKQTKHEWCSVLRRSKFLGYMALNGRIIDK